ncbi:Gfo/Idh/MocA family protein [Microbacterium sp. NPDC089696]|uniref:Gfo/Idh/MocA family protein n=1 Tax=Microbacterium sp. NPDC089696 TaxID=3364199 RepID=UPI00380D0B95
MTRIGLVGYGVGGRLFHAPYLLAARGVDLAGIVTTSPSRREQAVSDAPGVPLVDSLADLIALGVDAVVVTTPPETRQALVLEAIAAGVHVVADKPFAPDHRAAQELVAAADHAGVLLNVFHNRRLDTDIVTARQVIESGTLGLIQRLDLRLDQDDPSTLERGPGGGLLRDLGSHVVDQALHLLGPAVSVTARIDTVDDPEGRTDVAFALRLDHESGAHSHISSSKIHGLTSRELRVLGTSGSYWSDFTDVQFEAITRGERPGADRSDWGVEERARWGVLHTPQGSRTVPSGRGDYALFYEKFAEAVRTGSAGPVPAREGAAVSRVLEAARQSDRERCVVAL